MISGGGCKNPEIIEHDRGKKGGCHSHSGDALRRLDAFFGQNDVVCLGLVLVSKLTWEHHTASFSLSLLISLNRYSFNMQEHEDAGVTQR
jgi:hypothetical protein